MLRAVAKHSPQLAQAVVDCGALDALVVCLEEFDPGVKESAAWALGYIARHNAGLLFFIKIIKICTLFCTLFLLHLLFLLIVFINMVISIIKDNMYN